MSRNYTENSYFFCYNIQFYFLVSFCFLERSIHTIHKFRRAVSINDPSQCGQDEAADRVTFCEKENAGRLSEILAERSSALLFLLRKCTTKRESLMQSWHAILVLYRPQVPSNLKDQWRISR